MTNTNIHTRLNNLVCALRADKDNCDLVEDVRDTVMLTCLTKSVPASVSRLSLMWTRTTARATTRSPRRLLRQLS